MACPYCKREYGLERQKYTAGFLAGLEEAAKIAEDSIGTYVDGDMIAKAIRAFATQERGKEGGWRPK